MVKHLGGYVSTEESIIDATAGGWLYLPGSLTNYQYSVSICPGKRSEGDNTISRDNLS